MKKNVKINKFKLVKSKNKLISIIFGSIIPLISLSLIPNRNQKIENNFFYEKELTLEEQEIKNNILSEIKKGAIQKSSDSDYDLNNIFNTLQNQGDQNDAKKKWLTKDIQDPLKIQILKDELGIDITNYKNYFNYIFFKISSSRLAIAYEIRGIFLNQLIIPRLESFSRKDFSSEKIMFNSIYKRLEKLYLPSHKSNISDTKKEAIVEIIKNKILKNERNRILKQNIVFVPDDENGVLKIKITMPKEGHEIQDTIKEVNITGFNQKMSDNEGNQLVQNIQAIAGVNNSNIVVTNKKKYIAIETIQDSITSFSKFKDYTGKDLSSVSNIEKAAFASKKEDNKVKIIITIPALISNNEIEYKITGLKSQTLLNREGNQLVQNIKTIAGVNNSNIIVTNEKKYVAIETIQNSITSFSKFKDYTGKDLSSVSNIERAIFTSERDDDKVKVTITIPGLETNNEIEYKITGLKSQTLLNREGNQLVQNIKTIAGVNNSNIIVTNEKKYVAIETIQNSITSFSKFKDYTGKDLSSVSNIERAIFTSERDDDKVKVTITIPGLETNNEIEYKITGLKSQTLLNREGNQLVQNIKTIAGVNNSNIIVTNEKKYVAIETIQNSITSFSKFKDYTGKDLSSVSNIERAIFTSERDDDKVKVTITIPGLETNNEIEYKITGLKSQTLLNREGNQLVQNIKTIAGVNNSNIIVTNEKKYVAIETIQNSITSFSKFKDYTGKDLSSVSNIERAIFTSERDDDKVKVTITIPGLETNNEIEYKITGLKSQTLLNREGNQLVQNIKTIAGVNNSNIIVTNEKKYVAIETIQDSITSFSKFKDYTGKDLSSVSNIERAIFTSERDDDKVKVTITIPGLETNNEIEYKITGLKSQTLLNREGNQLVQNIKTIAGVNNSNIIVTNEKKYVAIETIQDSITSFSKFKDYTGKDLSSVSNIERAIFTSERDDDKVKVTITIPGLETNNEIEYKITGLKSQTLLNREGNQLVQNIKTIAGVNNSNIIVTNEKKYVAIETIQNSITSFSKFKDYTGKDLSSVSNIERAIFTSERDDDKVKVTITIPGLETNNEIEYKITGLKSQTLLNREGNQLVQNIKTIAGVNNSNIIVTNEKKYVAIETIQDSITSFSKFKDYTGKDLSSVSNIERAIFTSERDDDKVKVTITIPGLETNNEIEYKITGLKSQTLLNREGNQLVQNIKTIAGVNNSNIIVTNEKKYVAIETIQDSITSFSKFKDYTGKDLSSVSNIERAIFTSERDDDKVKVTITIPGLETNNEIEYKITGLKSQTLLNREGNQLVQNIKTIAGVNNSNIIVTNEKKYVAIETIQDSITSFSKFKDYTGKDLSSVSNIERAIFTSERDDDKVKVTITIPGLETNNEIEYKITGLKSQTLLNREGNQLVQNIKTIAGVNNSNIIVTNEKKYVAIETIQNSITSFSKFKDYTGKDLSSVSNIERAIFTSERDDDKVKVTITIPGLETNNEIEYKITGLKSQTLLNREGNQLVQNIKTIAGVNNSNIIVTNEKKYVAIETIQNSITSFSKFKDYTGKDLSSVSNIERAIFTSERDDDKVKVTITIPGLETNNEIEYKITGLKSQTLLNREGNQLVQNIKTIAGVNNSNIIVTNEKKYVAIETIQNSITSFSKFKDYTGKDLSSVSNIERAIFTSERDDDKVKVTITIPGLETNNEIEYKITGLKSRNNLDALEKINDLLTSDFNNVYNQVDKNKLASDPSNKNAKIPSIIQVIKSKFNNNEVKALITNDLISFDDSIEGKLIIKVSLTKFGELSTKNIEILGFKTQAQLNIALEKINDLLTSDFNNVYNQVDKNKLASDPSNKNAKIPSIIQVIKSKFNNNEVKALITNDLISFDDNNIQGKLIIKIALSSLGSSGTKNIIINGFKIQKQQVSSLKSSSLSKSVIAGIVISTIFAITIITFCITKFLKYKKTK